MPLQNRVLPTGEIVAHPARGLFMGNRGRLHTPGRTLSRRRWTTTTWVTCRLCFRDRHRLVMGHGYTELFFLDEAVALAAGHRPCAECRRHDYRRFQAAWRTAFAEDPTAPAMNARLHADRIDPARRAQPRLVMPLLDVPPGAFILGPDGASLVASNGLWCFSPHGYSRHPATVPSGDVTVITPRCTLAVLRAGYRPVLHPSAIAAAPSPDRQGG